MNFQGLLAPSAIAAINANKAVSPLIAKVQADPTLTAAQKAIQVAELYKIMATMTATGASTSTTPITVNPATGTATNPLTTQSQLPGGGLLPEYAPSFFDEHATAIKVGAGVAVAALVGYFVWKRRGL
jgi:hypothetical protein